MAKRWIVSWGFDSGKVVYYYTGRPLREDEAEMSELGGAADVRDYFHEWAVLEVEAGKRPHLALDPGDVALWAVGAAIGQYRDRTGTGWGASR